MPVSNWRWHGLLSLSLRGHRSLGRVKCTYSAIYALLALEQLDEGKEVVSRCDNMAEVKVEGEGRWEEGGGQEEKKESLGDGMKGSVWWCRRCPVATFFLPPTCGWVCIRVGGYHSWLGNPMTDDDWWAGPFLTRKFYSGGARAGLQELYV